MRECMFQGNLYYFHQWFVQQHPVGKLAGINGHGEGQVSELYAVLEDEFGCIKLVEYNRIRFVEPKRISYPRYYGNGERRPRYYDTIREETDGN